MAIMTRKLLDAVTATGAGAHRAPHRDNRTFQATGFTTAGAGSAIITVQGSNDGVNFVTVGTITLTLSTSESSDGFASDAAWAFIRGNVTTLSGTGATVTLWMGE